MSEKKYKGDFNGATRPTSETSVIVAPPVWAKEYLFTFEIENSNDGKTVRPHVPEWWKDFTTHLKEDYHSIKRIEAGCLNFGFKQAKAHHNHRLLAEYSSDLSKSKLEGDRYAQLPPFETDHESKCPERTTHIPVTEELLRDINNYKKFLECSRAEVIRHLFYYAVWYYDQETFFGEKFKNVIPEAHEGVVRFNEDIEARLEWINDGSVPLK